MKNTKTKLKIGERTIPDYGDVYTLEKFTDLCETGWLIDNDGVGYLANPPIMYNVQAIPSQLKELNVLAKKDQIYSHVVWFNR